MSYPLEGLSFTQGGRANVRIRSRQMQTALLFAGTYLGPDWAKTAYWSLENLPVAELPLKVAPGFMSQVFNNIWFISKAYVDPAYLGSVGMSAADRLKFMMLSKDVAQMGVAAFTARGFYELGDLIEKYSKSIAVVISQKSNETRKAQALLPEITSAHVKERLGPDGFDSGVTGGFLSYFWGSRPDPEYGPKVNMWYMPAYTTPIKPRLDRRFTTPRPLLALPAPKWFDGVTVPRPAPTQGPAPTPLALPAPPDYPQRSPPVPEYTPPILLPPPQFKPTPRRNRSEPVEQLALPAPPPVPLLAPPPGPIVDPGRLLPAPTDVTPEAREAIDTAEQVQDGNVDVRPMPPPTPDNFDPEPAPRDRVDPVIRPPPPPPPGSDPVGVVSKPSPAYDECIRCAMIAAGISVALKYSVAR